MSVMESGAVSAALGTHLNGINQGQSWPTGRK
jgi:hypothetical protein